MKRCRILAEKKQKNQLQDKKKPDKIKRKSVFGNGRKASPQQKGRMASALVQEGSRDQKTAEIREQQLLCTALFCREQRRLANSSFYELFSRKLQKQGKGMDYDR